MNGGQDMVVQIEHIDKIAIVTVDSPPVNALGMALRQALWEAAQSLEAAPSVDGVVLICAGRTFIAGADVAEFDKPPAPPHLPDLVDLIEQSSKPWVAAIHGAALGGGFEIAMGCRFRLALETASIGLPEVALGIVPGASGTVRTPRLAGVSAAVELVTSGRPISATKALDMGLLDRVVSSDLRRHAIEFARAALSDSLPPPISQRPVAPLDAAWWDGMRKTISQRAKGEIAPLRALDCVRYASENPFAPAMAHERATFLDLRQSAQAAALRHIFFAERGAARPPHLEGVAPSPMASVAVIGGGTMGAGIAAALLDAGLPVVMVERDAPSLDRGLDNLRGIFEGAIKRGKMTKEQASQRMAAFVATQDYGQVSHVDLVIEAVFEDISVKRGVFANLAQFCRSDTILATNTSYLDPREMAQDLPNPERFIGLHFFSPAHIMKLLEIVPLPMTDSKTLATGFALAKKLGKIPVQAGICDGFIGNRILRRYRAEAENLLRAGTPIADIDGAMREYGFAMGPFEAQDLGGLDIAFLQREAARAAGQNIAETLGDILVRAGRKGQKSAAGWYDYHEGDRTAHPSPRTAALLSEQITGKSALSFSQIAATLTGAMSDEGGAILAEEIALKSSDIDLVMVHGYGYPRWRGGPMFAAMGPASRLVPGT